jgi:protein TonB
MAATKKPYEQFGPYVLFRKLETDALGDLWRAGRIDGNALGPTVALRRLTGGNRDAFVQSAESAKAIAPLLSGTSFAKNQVIDIENGVPFIAHEYAGGRSLRHIIDRSRGGNGATPNPVPLDQAIVIAEKVALSLATTSDMKFQGNRLNHGALIPQFVWISEDGEIRVAGQQLGKAFAASLKDPKFAAEFGRYAAPELQTSGEPTKSSEVFSLGAMLFTLVTGVEPPDATSNSAFANAVLAAKTSIGQPIPDDIRAILAKSLVIDAGPRYGTVGDMKQALSALAHGGKYSATTFNLAFYLSSLLKKEMEIEGLERDKEAKVNIGAYVDVPAHAAATIPMAAPAPAIRDEPMFGAHQPEPKSKMPLAIAAVAVLAVIGGTAFVMLGKKGAQPAAQPVLASNIASSVPPAPPRVISQPVLASPATSTAPVDPNAQKKAFEDAVAQKMQEEMMKLQSEYTKKLQQQQAKNAPVPSAPAPASPSPQPARTQVAEERSPSASALDEQRRPASAAVQPPPQTASQAPSLPAAAPVQPQTQQPAPAVAQASGIREGDVVDVNSLDVIPAPLSPIRPIYPPMARAQGIVGTVMVTVLIGENGDVLDVKLLRGVGKMGLDDAAIRALRTTRFSSPRKDGKRVKTWYPQTIQFKP